MPLRVHASLSLENDANILSFWGLLFSQLEFDSMPLSLQNLADSLPAGALSVSGGNVLLDISLLLGQTVDSLSSETVSDLFRKLSKGAFDAQTAHNTANPTQVISSYGLPRSGVVSNDRVNETVTISWTRSLVSDSSEVQN